MKKFVPIIILFVSLNIMAQKDKRERIKALKVAFITERIDLSEKESQKFWPIYNDFENEINQIRFQDIRSIRKEIRDQINTMNEEQAKTLLKRLNTAESKLHNLESDFYKKISSVISYRKIILLKIAEEDFKRKMLEELKRRRHERG